MAKGKKKKVASVIKIQLPAGQATPAPPVGPVLGQHGLNIAEFVKSFNAKSEKYRGDIIPTIITVYEDRSYTFIMKQPPVAFLIKKAAGIDKGSGEPNKNKVGKLTKEQVAEIAKRKMVDMNTTILESAMRMVEGTARSMGIEIK